MNRVLTIVVHHRGAEMLSQCLASLLNSVGVSIEVVVVNNGCEEHLPPLASTEGSIHEVELRSPVGFSEANNLGFEWAVENLDPFDYVYFVNNDTLSQATALSLLVAGLRENPAAAIAGPQLVIWGAKAYLNSLGLNVTEDAWGWDEGIGILQRDYGPLPGLRSVLAVTGSALLMSPARFCEVGKWSEIYDYYFEDIDLCLKARRGGHDVINVPEAIVQHGISATMSEGSERKERFFRRNRLLLGFAHWPLHLWPTLLGRAIGREILLSPEADRKLPTSTLVAALKRLPAAWGLRGRSPFSEGAWSWTGLLKPPGTVPVISLPEVCFLPLEDRIEGGPSPPLVLEESEGAPLDRNLSSSVACSEVPRPIAGRRILVLGWSPLPFDEAQMNYAPGVRSWQLARSLAEDGHRVLLVTTSIPGTSEQTADSMSVRAGVEIKRLSWNRFQGVESDVLRDIIDSLDPEAIVGATPVPARRAVEVAGDRPLWIDLFGDPMAEAQSKAGVESGEHISAYRQLLGQLLDRGDRFSAVSDRQKWAVVGQLGLRGRLNSQTAGEALVSSIPCSSQSVDLSPAGSIEEGVVADDRFVVLWSGGYNTWCDVETLFEGLENAMQRDPRIHFVSTGGIIEGHDERTYPSLVRRVEDSLFKERYHLLGRRSKAEADAWVRRAQLGVITERSLYERDLGSSQRVMGWIAAGLPFVCTSASELGMLAMEDELGYCYEAGTPSSFADSLVAAVSDSVGLRARSLACVRWTESKGSDADLTSNLRDWAKDPRRSGDVGLVSLILGDEVSRLREDRQQLRSEFADTFRALRCARRDLEYSESEIERLKEFEKQYHQVRGELGQIHESRMWKLWMESIRFRGWVFNR